MARIQSSGLGSTLKYGILLTTFICLLIISCSKQEMGPQAISINKADVPRETARSSENIVSMDNVRDILEKESALSKSAATQEYDITPYGGTYDYNYNRTMTYGFAVAD